MSGPERFRKKTPTELRAQLRQAVAQLSGERLAPKGEMKELLALSEGEVKEKYPRRYEMYHSLLAGQVGDSNAWFGNSDKGAPLGSLDVSRMKKWLRALNNLDTYIADHNSGDSVTLKDRQATVFEDMRDFIERGGVPATSNCRLARGRQFSFLNSSKRSTCARSSLFRQNYW